MNLKNNLKGTYFCIAGGTGIIPFLDLFSLTFRYIIDRISRENFNNFENNLFNEDFNYITADFKLVIFAAYRNENGKIMDNFLQELNGLCKKYNINNFSYEINYQNKKSWNDNSIENFFF